MRTLLLLLSLLLVAPATARATVLLPIDFRELVTVSSTIVHGTVTDVRTQWVDGRRSIETFVTVAADDYLKGNLGGRITVRVPGGQIGRYRTIFVGAPEFREGDEVVLFLRSFQDRLLIVGLSQGVFRVVADAAGRRLVTSPVVMGQGSADPVPIVRGDASRRPLAVEAFRDLVKRLVAEGAAQ